MNKLTFENQPLELIDHNGRLWLRASDIARALGYSRTDKMSRIYAKHQAEFSPSMTCILENTLSGFSNLTTENRLFSLRGAHLLGMFARTAKGQTFRRWVLDQLERIDAQSSANRSLMAEWYEVRAEMSQQARFASLCGKGLSRWRFVKPVLAARLTALEQQSQPSLLLE